jgi:hypothetical protein
VHQPGGEAEAGGAGEHLLDRQALAGHLTADDHAAQRGVVDLGGEPAWQPVREVGVAQQHPERGVGAAQVLGVLAEERHRGDGQRCTEQ